jgi:aspartyl-tRNA(Asn)/glutamyl-tRNA(Gln) amidotransferase subunit C
MSLTEDQVKHIAKLSRIQLTDAEVEKYRTQLSAVLGYIEQLNELDTSAVEPTVNTTGMVDRLREDKVKDSLPVADATKNSKQTDKGFFVVPNVFE